MMMISASVRRAVKCALLTGFPPLIARYEKQVRLFLDVSDKLSGFRLTEIIGGGSGIKRAAEARSFRSFLSKCVHNKWKRSWKETDS